MGSISLICLSKCSYYWVIDKNKPTCQTSDMRSKTDIVGLVLKHVRTSGIISSL